ncbi:MAG: response regulator [bacterium]|nr:response regulator [bacterium]
MIVKKKQILVIENTPDVARYLKEKLESWGFEVTIASSGRAALNKISETLPALILLEENMPGMDGIHTLRLIRDLDEDIPVIMLSDYIPQELVDEKENLKIAGFSPKGYEFNKSAIMIREALLKKEKTSEKKKILVVEDEPDVRKALKIRLEDNNWDVLLAADGDEALKEIRKSRIDLIILDIMLPKMNGYKICRLIKFDAKYKHIPVIMLTVRAEKEDKISGMEAGAEEYITKPYSSELLIGKIRKYLEE